LDENETILLNISNNNFAINLYENFNYNKKPAGKRNNKIRKIQLHNLRKLIRKIFNQENKFMKKVLNPLNI
jgi:hemerythrin